MQVRERSERQLAAIVFTDIVDYSAIVHRDEVLGERLLERQRDVVRSIAPVYGGQATATGGDSFIMEFGSALAAVQAVIAIQQQLKRACAEHPDDPEVLLRASIHLGDVEHRGNDLFGDGVNTAARLLPLSPKGGLSLSSSVLALVRQRIQLDVQSIGTPPLKNIDTAPEVFLLEPHALQAIVLPDRPAAIVKASLLPADQPARVDIPQSGRSDATRGTFLSELRRRDVYRTASFYAVGGWLLVQIATQVFPFFDISNWAIRAFILVVVAGFPAALVLSWFYQITPSGLQREVEPSALAPGGTPVALPAPGNTRWKTMIAIALLAGLLITDLVVRQYAGRSDAAKPADARISIAVMPFKNIGANGDRAYLASGLQDEILTRLARVGSLKVISRASTEYYAAQPSDLRRIAKELGVTHLVEGSVQQFGDSARVAVQLIATATDSNLWAETYDRQLTNIFTVETEVATSITTALQARLTGAQQKELAAVPTRNAKAYDAYLRGIAFESRSFDRSYYAKAASSFASAVALDPDFALGWAKLARVNASRAFYGYDPGQRPCERARDALDNASRLGPEYGETDMARGYVRFMCDDDLAAAEQAFERARAKLPNSAEALRSISNIAWRRGDYATVIRYLRDAVQLDPRNADTLSTYALYLGNDRQFTEARSTADRVLNLNPDSTTTIAMMAGLDQAEGDLDASEKRLAGVALQPTTTELFDPQMLQLLFRGRNSEAIEALESAFTKDLSALGNNIADYYVLLANAYSASGNVAKAKDTYRKGHEALVAYDDGTISDLSSGGAYGRAMLCITATGFDATAIDSIDCKRTEKVANSTSQFALSTREALAMAQVLAGRNAEAIDSLTMLLTKPYSSPRYNTTPITPALLRQDPIWAPLRGNPAFQKLVSDTAGNGASTH